MKTYPLWKFVHRVLLVRLALTTAAVAVVVGLVTYRAQHLQLEREVEDLGRRGGLSLLETVRFTMARQKTDAVTALRWTFALSIIPGSLAILTIIFFVKEAGPVPKKASGPLFSLAAFDGNFKRYLLVVTLFTLGNSSDAFLLFRVEEAIHKSGAVVDFVNAIGPFGAMVSKFGTGEQQAQLVNILFLPLVWSFFHVIKSAFATPFGALSDRIGRKVTITLGWGIYALVYLCFALFIFLPAAAQVPATFVLFAVYALYYAFSEGAEKALVADLVPEGERGSAFGLFNFAVGLGALPASVLFGFLYSFFNSKTPGFGGTVAFGFGAALAMVSMLLLITIVKERRKADSRSSG